MRVVYWFGRAGDKFGGCERYNVRLAEKCKQRGHEIIIVHDIPNSVNEYNVALRSAGSRQVVVGNTYTDPYHALLEAVRLIRTWKPDIVHTHFVSPISLPVLKLLRVPLVYQTWHTSIDHRIRLHTRLIRRIGTRCTYRMFAVSNKVRQDEIRAGVPQSHIETLYMGVPVLGVVRSPEYCNELHPAGFDSTQTKIIITVARFFPEKGMKYVVNAAIRIIKENPSVLWWLVGDGPQRESFQAIAQQAGVTDRLLFLGTRNDVPCLMSRAYVNVLGSLFEGLGLSVLESATFGVPTIGTRVEGLNEAVLHGRTGILVSTESSEALADSVVKLLADVGLRNHLGQAAKDHVRAYFDSDRLIDNLLDIYESDLIQQNAR